MDRTTLDRRQCVREVAACLSDLPADLDEIAADTGLSRTMVIVALHDMTDCGVKLRYYPATDRVCVLPESRACVRAFAA